MRTLASPAFQTPARRLRREQLRLSRAEHTAHQRALMARLRAALLLATRKRSRDPNPAGPHALRREARSWRRQRLKAKDEDWPVTICVCDGGGVPLCLARLDGAFPRVRHARHGEGADGGAVPQTNSRFRERRERQATALIASGFTVLGGGEPIFVDGYCVGAVGVSGVLPTEDAEVAKAGAAAVCPTTLRPTSWTRRGFPFPLPPEERPASTTRASDVYSPREAPPLARPAGTAAAPPAR